MTWTVKDNWVSLYDDKVSSGGVIQQAFAGVVLPSLPQGVHVQIDIEKHVWVVFDDIEDTMRLYMPPDMNRRAIQKMVAQVLLVAG